MNRYFYCPLLLFTSCSIYPFVLLSVYTVFSLCVCIRIRSQMRFHCGKSSAGLSRGILSVLRYQTIHTKYIWFGGGSFDLRVRPDGTRVQSQHAFQHGVFGHAHTTAVQTDHRQLTSGAWDFPPSGRCSPLTSGPPGPFLSSLTTELFEAFITNTHLCETIEMKRLWMWHLVETGGVDFYRFDVCVSTGHVCFRGNHCPRGLLWPRRKIKPWRSAGTVTWNAVIKSQHFHCGASWQLIYSFISK